MKRQQVCVGMRLLLMNSGVAAIKWSVDSDDQGPHANDCPCTRAHPAGRAGETPRPCSLPRPNLKYFFFHLSHQIFRHMHRALNVGKKDN
jgi:hypothetical protein